MMKNHKTDTHVRRYMSSARARASTFVKQRTAMIRIRLKISKELKVLNNFLDFYTKLAKGSRDFPLKSQEK